ncbi:hypothetical protein NUM3379_38470 [Kineococcus sp. NUM-3379]
MARDDDWDEALGRALGAAGQEDPRTDVDRLLAGAHRRARVHRGRRRSTLLAVAAAALVAPFGLPGSWPVPERSGPLVTQPATTPAPQERRAGLLADADVRAVLPGLLPVGRTEGVPSQVPAGLCDDGPVDAGGVVLRDLGGIWAAPHPGGTVLPEGVSERVWVFSDPAAAEGFLHQVRVDSGACPHEAQESGVWQYDDTENYPAADVVAGFAPALADGSAWNTAALLREGEVVVQVHATVGGDQTRALDALRALSARALERATAVAP